MYAVGTGGDVHATLRFANGSVGSIAYLTDGSTRFPKETLDVTGDGRNGRLDNFSRVTVWSAKGRSGHRARRAGQGPAGAAQAVRRRGADRRRHADPARLPGRHDSGDLAVGESLATQKPVSW